MPSFYFKKYKFFLAKFLLFFLISHNVNGASIDVGDFLTIGNDNAPVQIKIYSSLTCPHCANFHRKVLPKIKKKYIETGLAKVIFMDFPLDLASLNASKILQCLENKKQIEYLDTIYEKQNKWTNGSSIEEININLKKIVKNLGIKESFVDKCFNNENIENKVLKSRIDGQKKYSIESTPTIIINEKKLDGSSDFKNIEKAIKKLI